MDTTLKRYLTEQEQRALLAAARGCSDPLAQRDYHWMRLLIETGARVNELATMTAGQAEAALQQGWLVVRAEQRKANGKGQRRSHEYLVTEPVRECLRALLKLQVAEAEGFDRAGDSGAPLLWGRDGDALSIRSYQARMKIWAKVAGLDPRLSPHWLRHTRGMNIVRRSRADNPAKVAQMALGHASMASTGIYLTASREEYVAALQATAGGQRTRRQVRAAARRAEAQPATTAQGV